MEPDAGIAAVGNVDGGAIADVDGWLRPTDPTTGVTDGSGGSGAGNDDGQPRRRGRKPGSKNTPKGDTASLKGVDVADILVSIHQLLAVRFRKPILALAPEEAKQIDAAIKRVAVHYPLSVSQKSLDIGLLVYALADVYGTRAVAIMTGNDGVQGAQPAPQSGMETVLPFLRPAAP